MIPQRGSAMEEEIQKHRAEKKRSEKLSRETERSGEHFIAATKEITAAEKHAEEAAKLQQKVDIGLRKTEKELAETEKEIIRTQRKVRAEKESEAEKAYGQARKKMPPLNKPSQ